MARGKVYNDVRIIADIQKAVLDKQRIDRKRFKASILPIICGALALFSIVLSAINSAAEQFCTVITVMACIAGCAALVSAPIYVYTPNVKYYRITKNKRIVQSWIEQHTSDASLCLLVEHKQGKPITHRIRILHDGIPCVDVNQDIVDLTTDVEWGVWFTPCHI